jgi:uncharacterized membrane protein
MLDYQMLKTLHILSSTFLWGTGVGTAFFMVMAHISKDVSTIRVTTRHVVLADWLFTTPTVILQPLTGLYLMHLMNISFETRWFVVVCALYSVTLVAWLPVVYLQLQLRKITSTLQQDDVLPQEYYRTFYRWVSLGFPAAFAMIGLFLMMVYKPWMSA